MKRTAAFMAKGLALAEGDAALVRKIEQAVRPYGPDHAATQTEMPKAPKPNP